QAVLRRDGGSAEGQVHDDAGADAVRVARHPARRYPGSKDPELRRGEAAARATHAGPGSGEVLAGLALEERHVIRGAWRSQGAGEEPALFVQPDEPRTRVRCYPSARAATRIST